MLIDWFTIIAQVVNFLILVWLMKHFLYKPILNAIDTREKKIASEIADANKKKAEAQKESDEFKKKNMEFDKQRAELLAKAKDSAKAEGDRLVLEARKTAADLSLKLKETLRSDEKNLFKSISQRTQSEVFSIARKALLDLSGANLEERMVDVFIREMRELKGTDKDHLISALKTQPGPLIVRTTFNLPLAQQTNIEAAIKEYFANGNKIQFEVTPDLVSGIELIAGGQKLEWSIANYLTSLEKDVSELLTKKELPEVRSQ
jgi:F-type H+-transporting ATPase subunit b